MKPALLKSLLLLGAATAHASSPERPENIQGHLITDPKEVADKEFDYIIAGGGLAGLTVAANLTKNPNISVLVIEKGFYESNDGPIVQNLEKYGHLLGTNADQMHSTSKAEINNQTLLLHSGKGLGGSTLLSKGTWTRPDKVQIGDWKDVFELEGWSWDDLKKYMDDAETSRAPTSDQVDAGHHFDGSCHGLEGTVHTGPRDNGKDWSPVMRALMNTASDRGIDTREDLSCGSPHGVSMVYDTILKDQSRAEAAREWLVPAYKRKNLKILTGQMVGKVLFDKSGLKANGVNFGTNKHVQFNATAKHEVLLAAGSIVSPLILQYSGIGIKSVLEDAGVEQRVELPVGVNLQDQISTTVSSRVKPSEKEQGQGQAVYFANFTETFGDQHVRATELLDQKINKWADEAVANGGFQNVTALRIQYKAISKWILKDGVALSVLFMDADSKIEMLVSGLTPFARGKVHISSEDPYLSEYKLDPRYFMNEFDVLTQAAASKRARELSSAGKMKEYWDGEEIPGYDVDPKADIDKWSDYVKKNFRPSSQPIGTCPMMSKDLGGVVDSKAKVYGIEGLRVIDASIIPTQVSPFPMAVLYGMALKHAHTISTDREDD